MPEQMFHDYGMIRRGRDGLLKVRMRGAGLAFDGFALPVGSNLYAFLYDPTGGTPMSLTFKGVTLPRAMVLEGLLLLAALDANRTPAAVPIVLERVADLTADRVADNARFAALESEAPAPLDPVAPEALAARLYRPVGGGNSDGREPFLSVGSLAALSRGATSAGLRG